jgi:hypothetical protein
MLMPHKLHFCRTAPFAPQITAQIFKTLLALQALQVPDITISAATACNASSLTVNNKNYTLVNHAIVPVYRNGSTVEVTFDLSTIDTYAANSRSCSLASTTGTCEAITCTTCASSNLNLIGRIHVVWTLDLLLDPTSDGALRWLPRVPILAYDHPPPAFGCHTVSLQPIYNGSGYQTAFYRFVFASLLVFRCFIEHESCLYFSC